MLPETQNIIATIKEKEEFLKSRYFIRHIDLYGSYAKGPQQKGSDI